MKQTYKFIMKKKTYILGLMACGIVALQACNHPRTENEEEREPLEREMSPFDGPASTTDTAHNDSIMQHDSVRLQGDSTSPNF